MHMHCVIWHQDSKTLPIGLHLEDCQTAMTGVDLHVASCQSFYVQATQHEQQGYVTLCLQTNKPR